MEIVYHLGAHCTDEDRILKTLLKNKGALAAEGIAVSGPGRYRGLFRDVLVRLKGARAPAEVQSLILDAVLEGSTAKRVLFSHEQFLCLPAKVLADDRLYPQAGEKAVWLRNVFPDNPVEFHIALRNPATFLPALFQVSGEADFTTLTQSVRPGALRWSDTIARLRAAVPEAPVTVWCNEDSPVIWPEILRAVAGHAETTALAAVEDFPASLMTPEGQNRMQVYLKTHPPANDRQRRRVVAAFLEKFAAPGALSEEFAPPGWTQALVDEMTAVYDEDLRTVAAIPGVRVLVP